MEEETLRLKCGGLKVILVGKRGEDPCSSSSGSRRGSGGSSNTTTSPPTWRLEIPSQNNDNIVKNTHPIQEFLTFSPSTEISARKLCANLWHSGLAHHHHHHDPPLAQKSRSVKKNPNSHPHPHRHSNFKCFEQARPRKSMNCLLNSEEQKNFHMSLVEAPDNQSGKKNIDELTDKISEVKVVKTKNEQGLIEAAFQSLKDEIEEERTLRNCLEIKYQNMARELCQVKSAFSNALKELEEERKASNLLERLCDEFAKGIQDYHKQEKDAVHVSRRNTDRLVHYLSEAWVDEKMRMKIIREKVWKDRAKWSIDESRKQCRSLPKKESEEAGNYNCINSNGLNLLQLEGEKTNSRNFERSESSLKWPRGVKEDTLMAKLLEARLEGQLSRSRKSC